MMMTMGDTDENHDKHGHIITDPVDDHDEETYLPVPHAISSNVQLSTFTW